MRPSTAKATVEPVTTVGSILADPSEARCASPLRPTSQLGTYAEYKSYKGRHNVNNNSVHKKAHTLPRLLAPSSSLQRTGGGRSSTPFSATICCAKSSKKSSSSHDDTTTTKISKLDQTQGSDTQNSWNYITDSVALTAAPSFSESRELPLELEQTRSSGTTAETNDHHSFVHQRTFYQELVSEEPNATGDTTILSRTDAQLRVPDLDDIERMVTVCTREAESRHMQGRGAPTTAEEDPSTTMNSWVLSLRGEMRNNALAVLLRSVDENAIIRALRREAYRMGLRDVGLQTFSYLIHKTAFQPRGGRRFGGWVPWLRVAAEEQQRRQEANGEAANTTSGAAAATATAAAASASAAPAPQPPSHTPHAPPPSSNTAAPPTGGDTHDSGNPTFSLQRKRSGRFSRQTSSLYNRSGTKRGIPAPPLPVVPQEDVRRMFCFLDWSCHGHVGVDTLLDRMRLLYREPYMLQAVCAKRVLYPRHTNNANTGDSEGFSAERRTLAPMRSESISSHTTFSAAVPIASDQLLISLAEICLMLDGVLQCVLHETTRELKQIEEDNTIETSMKNTANAEKDGNISPKSRRKQWEESDDDDEKASTRALQRTLDNLLRPQTTFLQNQQARHSQALRDKYPILQQIAREVYREMMNIHDGGFRVPVSAFRQACDRYPTLMHVVSHIQWDGTVKEEAATADNGFLGTLWRPTTSGGTQAYIHRKKRMQTDANNTIFASVNSKHSITSDVFTDQTKSNNNSSSQAFKQQQQQGRPPRTGLERSTSRTSIGLSGSQLTTGSKSNGVLGSTVPPPATATATATATAPLSPRERRARRKKKAHENALREAENIAILNYITALNHDDGKDPIQSVQAGSGTSNSNNNNNGITTRASSFRGTSAVWGDSAVFSMSATIARRRMQGPTKTDPTMPDFIADQYLNEEKNNMPSATTVVTFDE